MSETKLNITVEELARFLRGPLLGEWVFTNEEKAKWESKARRMLAADAMYEALLNVEANLMGPDYPEERVADSLRRARIALAQADGKGDQ